MNNVIDTIRKALLVSTATIATAVMALFGLFTMGGMLLVSIILLPLGALAVLTMPQVDLEEVIQGEYTNHNDDSATNPA